VMQETGMLVLASYGKTNNKLENFVLGQQI
jgi:hypothetical protein